VVRIIPNSSSGTSLGEVTLAGTNFPLPVSFGNLSPKTISSPGVVGDLLG